MVLSYKNYSTIEKEALAIVFAVSKFRQYIYGKKIILYTDHSPLQWLMSHRDTASKLIRWALLLQEYDIEIRYKKGKTNTNADSLSRIDSEQTIHNTVFSAVKQLNDLTEFKMDQDEDEEIIKIKSQAKRLKSPKQVEEFVKGTDKYFVENGILKYMDG